MTKLVFSILVFMSVHPMYAQDDVAIKTIFDETLRNGKSYEMLEHLTKEVGARLSGSPGAAEAVEWSRQVMEDAGFDSVWLQPVMVPHWVRGQKEVARISSKKMGTLSLNVCALGGAVGTGSSGVQAQIVEVKSFDELKELGSKGVKGKWVFFNRPMDPTKINTFIAYSGAVEQRGNGASEAAKYGAVGAIVRSMGLNSEEYPHTGGLRYAPNLPQLPAVAISTKHADLLSKSLKDDKDLQLYVETHCETLPDAPSYNVIGELRGGEYKDEIIVVSGHLDSWDLAEGAHDDGAGCVQSIEVLRVFERMGYKPKHTIRAVMYMNEENGLRGGLKYAEVALSNKEKHIAAIESDRGGFTPRGFSMAADEAVKKKVQSWQALFRPYDVWDFTEEGGGADIGPLANQGVPLFGFVPDSQRYFDYHHTSEDTFDKVNKRELELGAGAMAALVYLIDKYGLK